MNEQQLPRQRSSWVFKLPDTATQFLLGVYLVASQWNPCDSTSVSTGASLFLIVLGIALGLFTSLDRMLDDQEHRISLNWKLLVTGFFVWLAFATYQAYGRENFRSAMLGFWQSVGILGVVSSFYHQATKPGHLESMLRWVVGTVAGTILYALYQYFYSFPQLRAQFEASPETFLSDRNINLVPGSTEAIQWENRLMSTEPFGPFALTNSLAGFVGPWFVVIIAAILWILIPEFSDRERKTAGSREWIRRFPGYFLTLWLLVIGSIAVLVMTKSRTAWLATIVTGFLLLIGNSSVGRRSWERLRPYRAGFTLIFMIVGLIGAVTLWRDPLLLTEASKSFSYRLQYWRGAMSIVESSPLFGIGPLNFQNHYTAVKELTASETPADPHNMWGEIAVWGGIPALLIALAMALGLLQLFAVNIAREEVSGEERLRRLEPNRKGVIAVDFGASFGFVAVLSLSWLFADLDTKLSAALFVVAGFYTASSLTSPNWGRFVRENLSKIGLILCVFMGIHLFFSGGWMQPGSMNSIVIGASLAFIGSRVRPARTEDLHEWSPWIPLVTWSGLAIVFAVTTYVPESRYTNWVVDRQLGFWDGATLREWRDLQQIHKYAPEIPDAIGAHAWSRIVDRKIGDQARRDWLDLYIEATAEQLRRDPRSANTHFRIADQNLRLAEFLGVESEAGKELLEKGAEGFREAAKLSPTDISIQLQTAIVNFYVNDLTGAKERAEQVELIDETTPHLDRKLGASRVYIPNKLRSEFGLPSELLSPGPPRLEPGEPIQSKLRKLLRLEE